MDKKKNITIGIVGVCGSGKSTLLTNLKMYGYHAHHIAQEHSFVPDMWQQVTDPDILIYLEVTYETTIRRKGFSWELGEYEKQLHRLNHAKNHANILINTDDLSPESVILKVIKYIEQ